MKPVRQSGWSSLASRSVRRTVGRPPITSKSSIAYLSRSKKEYQEQSEGDEENRKSEGGGWGYERILSKRFEVANEWHFCTHSVEISNVQINFSLLRQSQQVQHLNSRQIKSKSQNKNKTNIISTSQSRPSSVSSRLLSYPAFE